MTVMISQKSTSKHGKCEIDDVDKNNFNTTLDENRGINDCSSKSASFNPSKLSSPNLFLSNLKFRLKYYGYNEILSHDILTI